jgi:peptide/nickel transport system ATP-binding protein
MSDTLLKVRDLRTWFGSGDQPVRAVDGISFDIAHGETLALLGESGCGKSITALSIMRLVPEPAGRIVSGSVKLDGSELLSLPEVAMRDIRGSKIAMIFQEPMTSLNPVLTVGEQIGESLTLHLGLRGEARTKRIIELLDQVGIPDPPRRLKEYPHQLSGGMKQRVMIAIALACEPELLIADEPTTALDVTIQAQILALLKELQQQRNMSILLITHDLGVVSDMADRVAVMYAGEMVELAGRQSFFSQPIHPYSRKLFQSLPTWEKRQQPLSVIKGFVPSLRQSFTGCRFAPRCEYAQDACQSSEPQWQALENGNGVRCLRYQDVLQEPAAAQDREPAADSSTQQQTLLQVKDLKVHFPIHKGVFKRTVGYVKAVDGIDLEIPSGRTVALVGESGCGKTTIGKGILQLIQPTSGSVRFEGTEMTSLGRKALRSKRRDMQIIFQDPFSSMNPRMLVADIVSEGLPPGLSREQRHARVADLLEHVGLRADMKDRYPHEFSGGQRQRIAIARALAVEPRLIICDEPTSALDVSVQAQILNLLTDLQQELQLSYLFVTHNISVVAYLADEIAVMYLGRIVEQGGVDDVLNSPRHPYTQALLSAVPQIDKDGGKEYVRLEGDMPSPANPPAGCHFHPRCQHARPECRQQYPEWVSVDQHHRYRCILQSGT